jgi:predicted DNA-binding transcriptional regulator YafY
VQINRLLEIVYILLDKKTVTAKELSRHFEVSQRTIYRDIDSLSAAGIPVYANKGKGGGICLLDNFVLNKSMLSDKEQIEILSSLEGLKALNVPDVEPVLKKLSVLFDKNNTNWIDVDFSYWGSDGKEREKFDLLKTAVLSSKMITFDYMNTYNEISKRVVEPIQIFFKEKSWYLKAYCKEKQDFRTFKIIRMKNIELTNQAFTKKMPKTQNSEFLNENPITLKLKFSKAVSNRIYDEFCQETITLNDDGSLTVIVKFPENEWIYGYIMSFGACCEVIEPHHIRELIKKRFKKSLDNYL